MGVLVMEVTVKSASGKGGGNEIPLTVP